MLSDSKQYYYEEVNDWEKSKGKECNFSFDVSGSDLRCPL